MAPHLSWRDLDALGQLDEGLVIWRHKDQLHLNGFRASRAMVVVRSDGHQRGGVGELSRRLTAQDAVSRDGESVGQAGGGKVNPVAVGVDSFEAVLIVALDRNHQAP